MKHHVPLYALAAAVLILVSVAFGVPTSTLFLVGFVLLCPLMMMFMMGGMHGSPRSGTKDPDGHSNDGPEDHDHTQSPSPDRFGHSLINKEKSP